MPLELWNTIFAGATFAVIAATAIAALIQLRHMRAGNQLNMVLTIMDMWSKPDMQEHIKYMRTALPEKVKDPAFLAEYERAGVSRAEHPEMLVADFWEQIGTLVKFGIIDQQALMDIACSQIIRAWADLEPIIMAARKRAGPVVFENFEYLVVLSHRWIDRHPQGTYPANMPRLAQYRSSRGGSTSSASSR